MGLLKKLVIFVYQETAGLKILNLVLLINCHQGSIGLQNFKPHVHMMYTERARRKSMNTYRWPIMALVVIIQVTKIISMLTRTQILLSTVKTKRNLPTQRVIVWQHSCFICRMCSKVDGQSSPGLVLLSGHKKAQRSFGIILKRVALLTWPCFMVDVQLFWGQSGLPTNGSESMPICSILLVEIALM